MVSCLRLTLHQRHRVRARDANKMDVLCLSKEFGFPCHQCDGSHIIPLGRDEMDDYECLLGDKCPLEPCKKSTSSGPGYVEPQHGEGGTSYGKSMARNLRSQYNSWGKEKMQEIYSNRDFPAPVRVVLELKVSRGGRYVCPYCGLLYDEEERGKEHVSGSHGQELCFKCTIDVCGQIFKRYGSYVRHVMKHHRACYKSEVFTCDKCKSEYTTMRDLYYHTRNNHSRANSRILCPYCGKEITQRNMLIHVKRKHQPASEWKCICRHPGCEEKFPHIDNTIKHERSTHSMW